MQAVYYRRSDGTEPVREFIDALSPSRQVVLGNQIRLLNMLRPNDPPLAFPHSSQVEGELRELRCHYGRELYRILYHRSSDLFILLHILEKRTGAIPRADVDVALQRMADFRQRMNTVPRWPPRAAGHDAP
jgi:phage-related protein